MRGARSPGDAGVRFVRRGGRGKRNEADAAEWRGPDLGVHRPLYRNRVPQTRADERPAKHRGSVKRRRRPARSRRAGAAPRAGSARRDDRGTVGRLPPAAPESVPPAAPRDAAPAEAPAAPGGRARRSLRVARARFARAGSAPAPRRLALPPPRSPREPGRPGRLRRCRRRRERASGPRWPGGGPHRAGARRRPARPATGGSRSRHPLPARSPARS